MNYQWNTPDGFGTGEAGDFVVELRMAGSSRAELRKTRSPKAKLRRASANDC